MQAANAEGDKTPFEDFVATIDSIDSDAKIRQHTVDEARTALLDHPMTAWALTYLSAIRMRDAINRGSAKDFIAADLLVRQANEIAQEIKEETSKKKALQEVKSNDEKAAERIRLADERFKAVAGCSLKSPDMEALKTFIGPKMELHHVLGHDLTVEILTEMMKTRDPNMLIPLALSMVQTCADLERACSAYDKWAVKRATVAKGERKKFGRRKVDQAELSRIDQKMSEIRSVTPQVEVRDIFREASEAALPVHEVGLETDLSQSWANVGASLEDLAAFTHANLARLKLDQIQGESEKRDAVSRQSGTPNDTGDTAMPGGSLLGEDDLDAWRERHGPR